MRPKGQHGGDATTLARRLHRSRNHRAMPQMSSVKHPDGQMERAGGERTRRFQTGKLGRQAHRTKLGTASRAGISRCSISGSVIA